MVEKTPAEKTPQTNCLIIAEIGNAHDGSLGMAHAYIDASTGSFVVQAVLGVVLSIIVPLQSFWAKRLTLKRNTGEN